jgi:hypothetical protein
MAPALNKPAPAFTVDAVVNGEFKKVSLSDYKGAPGCPQPPAVLCDRARLCRAAVRPAATLGSQRLS